jgi:DNA-binding FadR family transcriptional regulator
MRASARPTTEVSVTERPDRATSVRSERDATHISVAEMGVSLSRPAMRSTSRVANRIAQRIALELLDGGYQEGQRLPPEKELTAGLRRSRLALRGALRLLEAWGLITVKMGREGGPVVKRPTPADLVDGLAVAIQYQGVSRNDVMFVRRALEPILAEYVARNASDEQITRLEDLFMALAQSTSSDYDEHVIRFNRLMGEAAGLAVIADFLEALTLVSDSWVMSKLPFEADRRDHYVAGMRPVLEAIRNRDADGARTAARARRQESEQWWTQRRADLLSGAITTFDGTAIEPQSIVAPRPIAAAAKRSPQNRRPKSV